MASSFQCVVKVTERGSDRSSSRKVTIELQTLSTECSPLAIYSLGFPSILPLVNFRVMVHLPHLPCGETRVVEDHIEYIAVELALGHCHALKVVHGKGD